jgi:hypothetical protein
MDFSNNTEHTEYQGSNGNFHMAPAVFGNVRVSGRNSLGRKFDGSYITLRVNQGGSLSTLLLL